MSSRKSFASLIAASALVFTGCASQSQSPDAVAPDGSAVLNLELITGATIDEVTWEITREGMEPMSGVIDTSAPGATASVEVFGLEPGGGYTVTMTATSTDGGTTCRGSGDFSVEVGVATDIMVMLKCQTPPRFGAGRFNGKFNICAELTKAIVSPLQTSMGSEIDVSADATDAEGDNIRFSWTATGGSFADDAASSTVYTCSDPGPQEITITVSDDDFDYCNDSWTVPVNCLASFYLTVLHNNDAESQLINAGPDLADFGGAAPFRTLRIDSAEAAEPPPGTSGGPIFLSSGDNFLAGPEFQVSLNQGIPYFDTIAIELLDYDALSLGNHDFDFGPGVLENFLLGFTEAPIYAAANVDFSAEPGLQAFVESGVFVPSTIVEIDGEPVGVIGLETPNLPFISTPGGVVVSDDLASIVQAEVDGLEAQGVNKIILIGHLQNILNDIELATMIRGVDVIISGGGDELLANEGDVLIPGDEEEVFGAYPQFSMDLDGNSIPVVTTPGEYRYLGQLVIGFDDDGEVLVIDQGASGLKRVATGDCGGTLPCDDAVVPDPEMQQLVVDPVVEATNALAETIIADSEVALDGLRSSVRSIETNQGNLIADALLWQATEAAPSLGIPVPDVALQNGGGIRNNTVIPAGELSILDTFDILPFLNFVVVVPDIPRSQFKELLENAVSCTQDSDFEGNENCGSGRFTQVGGFSFTWAASGTPMIIADDESVVQMGTRVEQVTLDDGTQIVVDGELVDGDPINIAIVNFNANGGDQYPFRDAPFEGVGFTYQQSLQNYLTDALSGLVTATEYPEGGEGRIVELP